MSGVPSTSRKPVHLAVYDSDTAAYEVLTAAGSGAEAGTDAATSGTGADGPADGTHAGGTAGRGLGGE
ncbi:hypothetical protein [Streptomyces uncialis]|uniref:hypothetical protein n=1 Tax=Streptomyces uncialis TaxID=1048205 RepID=UPI00340A35AF